MKYQMVSPGNVHTNNIMQTKSMYLWIHICNIYVQQFMKRAIQSKELREEGYMGGFGGRKLYNIISTNENNILKIK